MSDDRLLVTISINGGSFQASIPANRILADIIREDLGLTGTRIGCDQGSCGSCTVLVDGVPAASCSTFAWQVDGKCVLTIEGLAKDGKLDPVQESFKAKSAFQCGYCTSGMIMLTKALLAEHPSPDPSTIRDWLAANVCRCTGYQMIIEAVEDAARRVEEARP